MMVTRGLSFVLLIFCCAPYSEAAETLKFPGTLLLADGKKVEFADISGIRLNLSTGNWDPVSGELVLVQKEEERIPFIDIARIEWDKAGKKTTIVLVNGGKKETSAIVGIEIIEKSGGAKSTYVGSPLDGATVTMEAKRSK